MSQPGLSVNFPVALVAGPVAISLPWVIYDFFAKSGGGIVALVAPFAFIVAMGATLVVGGPYYWMTRFNKPLSAALAYFLFGALFGPIALATGIYLFSADMLSDALATPPEGVSMNVIIAAFAACGGVSALVSRVAGARWKGGAET